MWASGLQQRKAHHKVEATNIGEAVMSSAHALSLTRISSRLHDLFDSSINLSDVAGKPEADRENFFLTRSLAALSLMEDADLSPEAASACVTDGGADDGIDAVYVDEKRRVMYFVQSKWRSTAKGVQLNDFTRFRDGVKSVINLNWTAENKNLHPFKQKIEASLKDIDTSIVMVLVHTSPEKLATNIKSKIGEFLDEQNKYQKDFLEFKEVDLTRVSDIARSKTRQSDINLSIMLGNWGRRFKPYDAVYGVVAGSDVARWYEDHGNKLFVENLRYVIEKSDVNEGISETADREPTNFWYFNNGITAICDAFDKQPVGGNNTESGVFDVRKISIINGAQTAGSLGKARASGVKLDDVYVHMRIISLTNTPEGFASSVTRSNNTQNDLSPADFVSFDPNQERIRKEAVQFGVIYSYRRGDAEPPRATGFDIRAATVAAACATGDLKLAVSAKRYISGLWDDIKKEPYIKLFNDTVSATYLWNIVRLMNAVDDFLTAQAAQMVGRERLIAIHGNRFVLFRVFSQIDLAPLKHQDVDLDAIKAQCEKLAQICLASMIPQINKLFPDSYPGNLFKNQDRQAQLLKVI